MLRERWYADDYELTDGDVMDVEYRSGQLGTPPMRGANGKVANRTGELWRPKLHDPGTFTLELWLGTNQRQAQQLWDEVLRACVQPHRLISWQRITADGESRYCDGEVVGAMQPTFIGQAAFRASLEVTVPGGYWRGDTLLSASSPLSSSGTTRSIDLSVFSTSTAPLEELTVTFAGQLDGPVLVDTTPRGRAAAVSYGDPIPAGGQLALDCSTWSVTQQGSWPTGYEYSASMLNYTGDRFWSLAATPPGITHSAQLTARSIGSTGQVTVSGYKSYLC